MNSNLPAFVHDRRVFIPVFWTALIGPAAIAFALGNPGAGLALCAPLMPLVMMFIANAIARGLFQRPGFGTPYIIMSFFFFMSIPQGLALIVGSSNLMLYQVVELIGGVIALALFAWSITSRLERRVRDNSGPDTTLGSATFWGIAEAINRHIFPLRQSEGLALGRMNKEGYDSRFRHKGHVVTVAPTGAGKGVSSVCPNLLEYQGSCFVVDIKGENYAITSRFRHETLGHKIVKIDPFGVSGSRGDSFDIIGWLRSNKEEWVSDSGYLAESIVVDGKEAEGNYWNEKAKSLIQGIILFLATAPSSSVKNESKGATDEIDEAFGDTKKDWIVKARNLGELRRILTLGEKDFLAVMAAMEDSDVPLVSRCGSSIAGTPERERGSIISTAQLHTHFLEEERVLSCFDTSTCHPENIKSEDQTIYLIIPPDRLALYGRFIRLFLTVTISGVLRSKGKPKHNVLFMLDEFAQLGKMSLVETSISLIRGYGAYFWILVQDLSQLKQTYEKWQTFLANSAKQFFSVADFDTAKYVSDTLGEYTENYQTTGESFSTSENVGSGGLSSGQSSSSSVTSHKAKRNLMTPDEVMAMNKYYTIVLIREERPWLLEKLDYLRQPEYKDLGDSNPQHQAM
jgi:type IV secretion system protein VirD4